MRMALQLGATVFGSAWLEDDEGEECVNFSGVVVHLKKSLAMIAVPPELGVRT